MDTWITTFTGQQFYPLAPTAEMIHIEDIAHHLALQVRWSGATREPLSIAQHSFHVAQLVAPEHRLWALLHDASEAYILDVARPLKHSVAYAGYRTAEALLQTVIQQAFGLVGDLPAEVKEADNLLLVAEAQDLLPHPPAWCIGAPRAPFTIEPWPAAKAERVFLNRFAELTKTSPQLELP
ncbi:COG1896 Predicted hydrolases of HD superfamily [uncultured Caudovirales phage]|uniref:COG1896 Predicted hydrolases of HD superfamily n=1 Tax=uncultured Caudovirales phage TaxID=2100421 RepID=A0A6J5Q7V7_9CAUD|nr:COG1896 Predicted hydrolases of HD superfamily [uncultured Caudovirales phage]CAB4199042.1 COG1896 Predicted hydrolases of HD superfamily [uncultured Caudovirales phage]CAB4213098.1 COG1896 Predicted hydrolases of HD superfamily [uncultured Caudovirales phage]CAB5228094.1 COG1896 Predicted hydrolases of HD superfamily [uncultured Caudovirales phage]